MSKLDPRIEEIRTKYNLQRDDFWELPQKKGTWIAKHSALEAVAVQASITFMPPQIIEAKTGDGIAVMVVEGRKEDGTTEWATGEASPSNYKVSPKQPGYPWAMAEKRAKDRVILKLVGLHGLVYSEDEGDFTQSKAKSRDVYGSLSDDIKACETPQDLRDWWQNSEVQAAIKSMPQDWQDQIIAEKDAMKSALEAAALAATP